MAWKKILVEGDAAVLSDTVPIDIDFSVASAGVATQASRQDHKHDVPEALVGDLAPVDGGDAAIGTANKFVRADHKHALGALQTNLDFNQNQADNMVLDVETTAPSTPTDGQIYYNSTDKHPYVYVA